MKWLKKMYHKNQFIKKNKEINKEKICNKYVRSVLVEAPSKIDRVIYI